MAKKELLKLEDGTEELIPEYSKIIAVGYNVFRIDTDGGRYYVIRYRDDRAKLHQLYMPSCTTVINKSMPTPEPIQKLQATMGWDNFWQYVKTRAAYGSVMHMLISELFVIKSIKADGLHKRIMDMIYAIYPVQLETLSTLATELIRDLLAFMQFVVDHKVVPYSIELPLASFKGGYCMAIDMVCTLSIVETGFFGEVYKSGDRKDEPKETKQERTVFAYVDFKSGKKGFFSTHELQLAMGEQVLKENYPDLARTLTGSDDIFLFNWAPSAWRGKTPTYKLKDQRGKVDDNDMWARIQLGRSESKKEIPARFVLHESLKLGVDPSTLFTFTEIDF